MPAQIVDVTFPFKGFDENAAYRRQPEGTTSDCLNVRPYDSLGRRLRGGQRDGLSKYIADAVSSPNHIQLIDQVTLAIDPSDIEPSTLLFSDKFTYANGQLPNTHWYRMEGDHSGDPPSVPVSTLATSVNGYPLVNLNTVNPTGSGVTLKIAGGIVRDVITVGSNYVIKCKIQALAEADVYQSVFLVFRCGDPSGGNVASDDYAIAGFKVLKTTTVITCRGYINVGTDDLVQSDQLSDMEYPATFWTTEREIEVRVSGNTISLWLEGIRILQTTTTTLAANEYVGFLMNHGAAGGNDPDYAVDDFEVWSGTPSLSLRSTKLIVVSQGDLYTGTKDGGLVASYGGTDVLSASRQPSGVEAFQKMYLCDGFTAHYGRLTVATNIWDDWGAAVTAHIAGTVLPQGSVDTTVSCRHSTLYRGRIILWGLHEEPHNWFASAVGNPLDWDYAPATISATMAIAGNNSDAGELGDVLIACAPYSDDLMIMGGDHTLWVMRGDPAAGGTIDNISYETGISSPDAFAWSPEGELYFVGAGQLWRMVAANAQPEPISQRRLDETFRTINLSTYRIELIWDRQRQGLHIFLIPNSQPAAGNAPVHIYWDRRTDSFWKDQYPEALGPTAVHTYDADAPDDRAILLGGWDSYIRFADSNTKEDDGTKISSHVKFSPIVLYGDLINSKLVALQVNMAENSDPVRIEVYAASTAEAVNAEVTPKFVHTLSSGRHAIIRQRASDNAILFKFIQDDILNSYSWALESMSAVFQPGGLVRRY